MLEEEYPLKLNKFELFRHKTLEERAAEFEINKICLNIEKLID